MHLPRILLLLPALILLATAAATATSTAYAQVDTFAFENDEQQQRFRRLSNEFRCPMCQNANLTGSTGGVAEDLRREIHRMILAGNSDSEIEQFMFERYGDFIFYRPRLRPDTVLLWFGPILFLLLGGYVGWRILRQAGHRQQGPAGGSLDAAEQERLRRLLDEANHD